MKRGKVSGTESWNFKVNFRQQGKGIDFAIYKFRQKN